MEIKLITAKEIEERYGAPSEKTLLNRKGGTENLTRIKLGRSVRFIESEVSAWMAERIEEARAVARPTNGNI